MWIVRIVKQGERRRRVDDGRPLNDLSKAAKLIHDGARATETGEFKAASACCWDTSLISMRLRDEELEVTGKGPDPSEEEAIRC